MAARGSLPTLQDGRSTSTTPSSEAPSSSLPDNEDSIVEIAAHGDLLLHIEHAIDRTMASRSFRVSSPALKTHSKYFDSLLQPGRFSEATAIDDKHKSLREQYANIAHAPSDELPVLNIKDLGRISVKSIGPLLTDFFYIFHGKDAQTYPPVVNLANLAIVADRFDALEIVKSYVRRKKMIRALDGKTTAKAEMALSEEKTRQRLLVAVLLDYPLWVDKYSLRLMMKGWVGKETPLSSPLWWDIPSRVEEELVYRRECILETMQSLQGHFLSLYTSRDRLCKLGYDSSPQCDSFQLGEMVRFFSRIGTLQFQGTIIDANDPPETHAGDLNALLDNLRQIPEYQIDRFHTHCGIRTKLVPLLDFLQKCIAHAGICAECWHDDKEGYAWVGAKRPLLWKKTSFRLWDHGHVDRHVGIRDLFTATERQWS